MMFYRRKILLAFIESFDNQLDKIRLQKLLFLFMQKKSNPEYDFIPYKYGCYSYSAHADLLSMVKQGILLEDEKSFKNVKTTDFFNTLKEQDKELLLNIKADYGQMNAEALMKHTYIHFPYWAINSVKAKKILSSEELKKVTTCLHKSDDIVLFTIGYQGISLEEYLNRLLKNNVKLLIDVRNNPISMKYGFSKNALKTYCESIKIKYEHIPELGISTEQRKELHSQLDYHKLFTAYCENTLKTTLDQQEKILSLLKEHKRIALTCFEADICQCHRKYLAEAIENLPDFKYKVQHI